MGAYATPWGSPYGYAVDDRVNVYNDSQSALLKDVRKVNNIWRYLRDGYLGKYLPTFIRQFYLTYDYLAIGFDSEEEFAYRLAAKLENVETEYMGRLNSEDLIKNPLVSRIIQDDTYNLQSERTKRYDVSNNISDRVGVDQRSVLGITGNTNQHAMNEAARGASDTHEQQTHQQETIEDTVMLTQHATLEVNQTTNQEVQNTATRAARDNHEQRTQHGETIEDDVRLSEKAIAETNQTTNQQVSNASGRSGSDVHNQQTSHTETVMDNSTTTHNLERFSEAPQNSMLTTDQAPIGWNGTGGTGAEKQELVHYPKKESLVALPWNEGYQTTATLVNNAHDQHNTTGTEGQTDNITQTRGSTMSGSESIGNTAAVNRHTDQGTVRGERSTGQESLENQIVQSRRSELTGMEQSGNTAAVNRRDRQTIDRGEISTGEESLQDQYVQNRTSNLRGLEEASKSIGTSQSNNQGITRGQARGYNDRIAQTALIHDNEQSRQLIGLEGRTVGSVWAEWQNNQRFKNAIGDLVNECRSCFLIVA